MQPADLHSIGQDYPVLQRYLGELRFAACVTECIASNISWKQAADALPKQFESHFQTMPELAEMARLELCMRKAFEAPEPAPPGKETLHPSASLLVFKQNTSSLWSALICGEAPPRPYPLDKPQHVVVWRHKGHARMRLLGEEEYLCIEALHAPRKMSIMEIPPVMPSYVPGWLESELVLAATA